MDAEYKPTDFDASIVWPTQAMISIDATYAPWWKRLGAVLALPWHLIRFVVAGRVAFMVTKGADTK